MIEQHILITPTYKEVKRTTPVSAVVHTDEVLPRRHDVAKEYKVALTLTTNFLAEDNQHSFAEGKKHAVRVLKAELYSDISRILTYARKAVYEQDWPLAMQRLDEIEKICE